MPIYKTYAELDLPERTDFHEREYRRGYLDGWIQATQVVCGLLFLKNRTAIYNIMWDHWVGPLTKWRGKTGPLSIMDWPPSIPEGKVKCAYCGRPATTMDHIIPKSKGGSDDLTNLVPACFGCNTSKGAKSLADWRNGQYVAMVGSGEAD